MRIKTVLRRLGIATKSLFYRRDRKIVLCGAWFGDKFADNSRYLYQYLSENKDALGLKKVVWVTRNESVLKTMRDMGYEVYPMDSKESIYYHKKAKYHIICNSPGDQGERGDIMGQYSYGAKRINLWHGLGNKRTGKLSNAQESGTNTKQQKMDAWLMKHCRLYQNFYRRDGGWANYYHLSPTEMMSEVFEKAYQLPKKRIIKAGYPRNALCPRPTPQEQALIERIQAAKTTVLYLPTFRQDGGFAPGELGNRIGDYLEENGILWLQKLHSADKSALQEGGSEAVVSLDPNFDINVILGQVDFVITDYSSVFSDALYHRKPLLFYVPDFDAYKKGQNGLLFEPELVMRGLFAKTPEELKECLSAYLADRQIAFDEGYENARRLYWGEGLCQLDEIWQELVRTCK